MSTFFKYQRSFAHLTSFTGGLKPDFNKLKQCFLNESLICNWLPYPTWRASTPTKHPRTVQQSRNILHWWLRHQYERHSDDLEKRQNLRMKEIRKKMWGYKKKIWGYQKNLRMKKIRKKSGVTNFCVKCKRIPFTIPKKVQILNVSNIVHKCFKYCPQEYCPPSNIVHTNIVPLFGEVWKFWVYTQM